MTLDLRLFREEIHTMIKLVAKLATLHSDRYCELTSTTAAMINFTQHSSAVEHRLLSIRVAVQDHASPQDSDFFIYEASRIATLICMTYLFRQMIPQSQILIILQKLLRDTFISIEALDRTAMTEDLVPLLLWASVMGGLVSIDQSWFAIRIHYYMLSLAEKLEDLEIYLEKYVWTPKLRDHRFIALLLEVQALRQCPTFQFP